MYFVKVLHIFPSVKKFIGFLAGENVVCTSINEYISLCSMLLRYITYSYSYPRLNCLSLLRLRWEFPFLDILLLVLSVSS